MSRDLSWAAEGQRVAGGRGAGVPGPPLPLRREDSGSRWKGRWWWGRWEAGHSWTEGSPGRNLKKNKQCIYFLLLTVPSLSLLLRLNIEV
jgi:hypothetical protein